jgi:type I restriction enzyme M protein
MTNFRDKVSFIWSIADLLRGDYKQSEYGKVILPLTVLRRLDCVLAPTKDAVLKRAEQMRGTALENVEPILNRVSGQRFHNTSRFDFQLLLGDPAHLAANLEQYVHSFSEKARRILDAFQFAQQIERLSRANLLYPIIQSFARIDLHPESVSNLEMGYIFEELIRRFSEASNETAGEHFTPREVIRQLVDVVIGEDTEALRTPGAVRTLFDPAGGTGGMLSVGDDYMRELNPDASLELFAQELNPESYAICNADMMIKGQNPDNVKLGNSFTEDGFAGKRFDYMLSNPPFGVEWKKVEKKVRDEHERLGHAGRFGAGLPRINDGSFLFVQHMLSKMKQSGSRIGVVLSGSPLFAGGAGSGESEIRRWILENDWLEAIIALPTDLFYNTGIATYIWVLTNRKSPERRGKVQLIDATGFSRKMPKSLGSKRNYIADEQIAEITRIHGEFREGKHSKIFRNEEFGYQRITVERPLRLNFQTSSERVERLKAERAFVAQAQSRKKGAAAEKEIAEGQRLQEEILAALATMDATVLHRNRHAFEKALSTALRAAGLSVGAPVRRAILSALSEPDSEADICVDAKGNPEPDPALRDYENVPLTEDIHAYFEREVRPHAEDAWTDESKTRIGYEIPFNRYFYQYEELRPSAEIADDLRAIESRIMQKLQEVLA